MGVHEDYPEWSAKVHFTAAKLAELDGLDPFAPAGDKPVHCGKLGWFTNQDAYLIEAEEAVGPPTRALAVVARERIVARKSRK